ncbi:NADPH oxidase activator 1 [Poecilia reticulata]|uniref:NADPH oxidase activator 1 n=1 Tax=Poecilia reticulata TaxID=8081 RepID=UPI0007EA72FB|nr:PREDICTED: neutrophil cytosol factor 2-like [Poecilia reticulata]
MPYTELLRLWNESVQAVDAKDWEGALAKLQQIPEQTSRTHFNAASAHLALGQMDMALRCLDLTIAKDERLAVAFFQRAAVMLQMDRLEEALSDCIWAQEHMRGNAVIDYRQLGLRYKLYYWQDFLLLCCNLQVISSMIPNDDFGGFEPLRQQKPGFYEPKTDGVQESRYMRVRAPYMARGPGQLTVPGGSVVFLFGEEDRDGMINVIHDGQRGLLPVSLLEPAKVKKSKTENHVPSGIPLPPEHKPPSRPETLPRSMVPPRVSPSTETPHPSYNNATHTQPPASGPPRYTANAASNKQAGSPQRAEEGTVVVKVHYTYNLALSIPLDTPYHKLKERIAEKVGQSASQLRLRHKQSGSRVLLPLPGEEESGRTVQEVAEAGRVTLWCQREDPLANRTILYQMVALYDYAAEGPEDLEFSEGDTIDILTEVNQEWLEGHCAGNIGIFPSSFAYKENKSITQD